ncbi:unnamed protein product [Cylicostephanus goldi]|uniref:Annexin n=1 Tax=Cylicostephanus goldi TaxID=71465 RepID=A0A3P6RRR9_CYLGO|nr:unnamed protein product [Cylicostephanus goldi]
MYYCSASLFHFALAEETNLTTPISLEPISAGERRLGTDESCFNQILASQNFNQLRLVFAEYEKVTKHSIERAIESEFSGDIRDGLLALVAVVRNRPAYFAKLLYESMKAMYKTSLENMIKGDCSGSYKDGLIALVNGN